MVTGVLLDKPPVVIELHSDDDISSVSFSDEDEKHNEWKVADGVASGMSDDDGASQDYLPKESDTSSLLDMTEYHHSHQDEVYEDDFEDDVEALDNAQHTPDVTQQVVDAVVATAQLHMELAPTARLAELRERELRRLSSSLKQQQQQHSVQQHSARPLSHEQPAQLPPPTAAAATAHLAKHPPAHQSAPQPHPTLAALLPESIATVADYVQRHLLCTSNQPQDPRGHPIPRGQLAHHLTQQLATHIRLLGGN